MFVGIQVVQVGEDVSNEAYVIPVEIIIDYKKANIYDKSEEINANEYLENGNRHFQAKRYSDAIACYDQITNDENYSSAWINKGQSYQNILNCNKECWKLFHDKDSSPKIKLQALKTSIDCNRELNQLVNDSTSVSTLENLKKKVEELAASQDNTAVRSYMTVPLPTFVESESIDYR